jgi:putative transcriptional regulator
MLISEPFLDDVHFGRSVILICDHDTKEGTVGFIINKSLETPVSEIMASIHDFDADVFYGGPVQNDTLHYLHTKGDLITGSIKVTDGIFWGGDYQQVKFCIKNGLIEPHEIKFFIGYAGWTSEQLFEELEEVTWIVAEGDADYIFTHSPKYLWKIALEQKGGRYAVIAQMENDLLN